MLSLNRRYVANSSLFEAMVEAGTKFKDHQWALGGNAPVMARRLGLEGFDVLLGARMGSSALKAIPDSVKGGPSIPLTSH